MTRSAGPIIEGKTLGPKTLRPEEPELLQHYGLRPPKKMCAKSAGDNFKCQSQLEFLTPEDAKLLKLPVGTTMALHKCVRPNSMEGAFIPVKTSEEAFRKATAFCDCVTDGMGEKREQKVSRAQVQKLTAVRTKCARKR